MRFTKEGLDILLGNKSLPDRSFVPVSGPSIPKMQQQGVPFKSPAAPAFGKKEGK
ncbi:MAG: hypothetical protein [Caudoviricetes sp.]|nr:MAG: hypothetical protein [Caudoviricetes sp.]